MRYRPPRCPTSPRSRSEAAGRARSRTGSLPEPRSSAPAGRAERHAAASAGLRPNPSRRSDPVAPRRRCRDGDRDVRVGHQANRAGARLSHHAVKVHAAGGGIKPSAASPRHCPVSSSDAPVDLQSTTGFPRCVHLPSSVSSASRGGGQFFVAPRGAIFHGVRQQTGDARSSLLRLAASLRGQKALRPIRQEQRLCARARTVLKFPDLLGSHDFPLP